MTGSEGPSKNDEPHTKSEIDGRRKKGIPAAPREPKHSKFTIYGVSVVMGFYSTPALIIIIHGKDLPFLGMTKWLSLTLPFLVFLGLITHWLQYDYFEISDEDCKSFCKIAKILRFPASGNWAPNEDNGLKISNMNFENSDLETLRAEYIQINEEAKYRDKLLLRTTYFALGGISVFAGIFLPLQSNIRPFLAMLASLVMLTFVIAAYSYKDSRDALWDRAGKLEVYVEPFENKLTTFRTIRAMKLRGFNRMSLSGYSVGLVVFLWLLTVLIYVVTSFSLANFPKISLP